MVDVITRDELVGWAQGQIKASTTVEQTVVDTIVAAVNDYVGRLPVARRIIPAVDGGQPTIPGGIKLGALMLAARTHRRRNSPNGIEAVTGDTVAYVSRHDPEVRRYLELDRPVAR